MAVTRQRIALFEETCAEVLKRLEGDESPTAVRLRTEAKDILDVVKVWSTRPQTSNERADTVAKVIDLHTRTMNHVTARRSRP